VPLEVLRRFVLQRLELVDLRDYVVYLGFVVVLVFFALALPNEGFVTASNLMNIVRQTTPISVMAVGMAFALSASALRSGR
jgi:ribose transport system permease protein